MPSVIFVMGLQGIGKSTWIEGDYTKDALILDYECLYEDARTRYPFMDRYEMPTYVKMAAALKLNGLLSFSEDIYVEATGMTKVNQAAIRYLADLAIEEGFDVRFEYLQMAGSADRFADLLRRCDDARGYSMFQAYRSGGPQWREPNLCPYLPEVKVVPVYPDDIQDAMDYESEMYERMHGSMIVR